MRQARNAVTQESAIESETTESRRRRVHRSKPLSEGPLVRTATLYGARQPSMPHGNPLLALLAGLLKLLAGRRWQISHRALRCLFEEQ